MEIKININDYLSKEEIKEECKAAIRHSVYEHYRQEAEIDRLITNLSYEFIFKAIQETTGQDVLNQIKSKVSELASKTDTIKFELFRKADSWNKTESVGMTILNNALKENESLIKEKVKEAIGNYDFISRSDLQTRMEDTFHEILVEKLFHNSEG